MNPGNREKFENVGVLFALNEVPGYESRQCLRSKTPQKRRFPLNEVPGYESRQYGENIALVTLVGPSMKCRDMNPGNFKHSDSFLLFCDSLNEVPGYESRQFQRRHEVRKPNRPSMKCRDMNPGNLALVNGTGITFNPQ